MKKKMEPRFLLGAMVLLVALSSSSCITRRAADVLTLRQRAQDGEFWEKKAGVTFTRFEVKAGDGVSLSALEIAPASGTCKLGTAYLFHGLGNSKEQMLLTAKHLC